MLSIVIWIELIIVRLHWIVITLINRFIFCFILNFHFKLVFFTCFGIFFFELIRAIGTICR